MKKKKDYKKLFLGFLYLGFGVCNAFLFSFFSIIMYLTKLQNGLVYLFYVVTFSTMILFFILYTEEMIKGGWDK